MDLILGPAPIVAPGYTRYTVAAAIPGPGLVHWEGVLGACILLDFLFIGIFDNTIFKY